MRELLELLIPILFCLLAAGAYTYRQKRIAQLHHQYRQALEAGDWQRAKAFGKAYLKYLDQGDLDMRDVNIDQ